MIGKASRSDDDKYRAPDKFSHAELHCRPSCATTVNWSASRFTAVPSAMPDTVTGTDRPRRSFPAYCVNEVVWLLVSSASGNGALPRGYIFVIIPGRLPKETPPAITNAPASRTMRETHTLRRAYWSTIADAVAPTITKKAAIPPAGVEKLPWSTNAISTSTTSAARKIPSSVSVIRPKLEVIAAIGISGTMLAPARRIRPKLTPGKYLNGRNPPSANNTHRALNKGSSTKVSRLIPFAPSRPVHSYGLV